MMRHVEPPEMKGSTGVEVGPELVTSSMALRLKLERECEATRHTEKSAMASWKEFFFSQVVGHRFPWTTIRPKWTSCSGGTNIAKLFLLQVTPTDWKFEGL